MEEQDGIRTVVSRAVAKFEADLGQTRRMAGKRHNRPGEARTGKI